MVIKRKTRNLILDTPLRFWVMAGVSSIVLVGVVVTLSTRTVHADARLFRPITTTMTVAPSTVASPTPDTLVAQQTAIKRGDRLHGIASWYGGVFNGRKTASGERFDMFAMTACHPSLPFGSLVRVINKTNKHSVIVKITDRGDLVHEGRIIDLSYGAAQQLAITKIGLAKVDLDVISLGVSKNKR
jgi:rare lipoprotein A